MSSIYTAPIYKLEELNNVFIELTAKNCNQRCKNCYIDFPNNKKVKDFIPLDKIKTAFDELKNQNIHCIYLTGAEPMTHPDFNTILRFCLKKYNVCICTNGSFLNEKKIRFLNKVEAENNNQILFKLSITHFDEHENDKVKYRGHFRQTIFALKTLSRYNFSAVLSFENYYKLDKALVEEMFNKLFKEQEIFTIDLQVINSHPHHDDNNYLKPAAKTDCMYGRVLCSTGVYACPFLSGDYRGRVGGSFLSFSEIIFADTDFCATCSKNNDFMFTIG